jgi:riboflavin biosynthesis pyrimidine reductase
MRYCYAKGIQSILVEGGTKTIEALMEKMEVQELIQIESDLELNEGIAAPRLANEDFQSYPIGSNNRWKKR